jgi:GT2 family glycosyltransferase
MEAALTLPEHREFESVAITFCLMTLNRTPWLKRSLDSIRDHCPVRYYVKVLCQGRPEAELVAYFEALNDNCIELIVSPVNIGTGGGRRFLAGQVGTSFTMMMDDDMCLTENSIEQAMKVFRGNPEIGAISMPQYDDGGRLLSFGGRILTVKNGVVSRQRPTMSDSEFIEVNDLDGGAMLYRTEMRREFTWDARFRNAFDDLDKSLQITKSGKWKQVILPKGRLIHDRSWLGRNPAYQKRRVDTFAWRRQYRVLRMKWKLRLDMKSHVLFELVYPTLAVIRSNLPMTLLGRFFQMREGKRGSRLLRSSRAIDLEGG